MDKKYWAKSREISKICSPTCTTLGAYKTKTSVQKQTEKSLISPLQIVYLNSIIVNIETKIFIIIDFTTYFAALSCFDCKIVLIFFK